MKDFRIEQINDSKITVGGIKSLTDFFSNKIVVRVVGGEITINGENLLIERFDENEIIVLGKISGVLIND
ncbi:MAG: YabP/YqfC family sporulation protein [Christensenellaceae bacterium]|nr:YabP/YqfC family sporulation protein [Christensenellaceae bacterium]